MRWQKTGIVRILGGVWTLTALLLGELEGQGHSASVFLTELILSRRVQGVGLEHKADLTSGLLLRPATLLQVKELLHCVIFWELQYSVALSAARFPPSTI